MAFALALVALLAPGRAAAQKLSPKPGLGASLVRGGKHCLDEQQTKLMLNHYTAGSINPLGIETQFRLSLCKPLIEKPGILWSFSRIDHGLVTFISPTHIHVGPSLHVAPLSFLVLRAEVTGFYIWPIPLQGAGFNEVIAEKKDPNMRGCFLDKDRPIDPSDKQAGADPSNPYCDYNPQKGETPVNAFHNDLLNRPANGYRASQSTYGVRAALGVTLQGAIPLGQRADLLFANGFTAEYWRVASDGYYFLARRDVMMLGSGDWVLANTAALLVSIKVHPNAALRIGATDDLVYTPNFGYTGNVAAGLVAIQVNNLRNLAKQFAFFLRIGGFTKHAFRGIETAPWTLAGGFDITYELWKRPTKKALEQEAAAAAEAAAQQAAAQPADPSIPVAVPVAAPAPASSPTTEDPSRGSTAAPPATAPPAGPN